MAEIVDLHEYFMCCADCGCHWWAIQTNTDQDEILGMVCQECTQFVENPNLKDEITFEPDFDLEE